MRGVRNSNRMLPVTLLNVAMVVIILFSVAMIIALFNRSDPPGTRRTVREVTVSPQAIVNPPPATMSSTHAVDKLRNNSTAKLKNGLNTKSDDKASSRLDDISNRGTVSGKIYNKSGNPIAGARVMALPQGGGWDYAQTADENGCYLITVGEICGGGNYCIIVRKEGYPDASRHFIPVFYGRETSNVDFQLQKGTDVIVTVNGEEGQPIAGVKVGIYPKSPRKRCGPKYSFRGCTNDDGSIEFRTLSPGRYWIEAYSIGYIRQKAKNIFVERGTPAEVTITLVRGASLSGRIIDEESNPVPGATVGVWPAAGTNHEKMYTCVTSEDGTYGIKGIKSGDYVVWGSRNGYLKTKEKRVSLVAGQFLENVDLILPRGDSINGSVVDQEGNPIKNVKIIAFPSGWSAKSDEKGEYEITGLTDTESTYRLYVCHTPRGYFSAASQENISLGARNVTLILEKGATVEGRVTSSDPVDNFTVNLLVCDAENPSKKKIIRRELFRYKKKGAFQIGLLRPGAYWVEAVNHDHKPGPAVKVTINRSGETISFVELKLGLKTSSPSKDYYRNEFRYESEAEKLHE